MFTTEVKLLSEFGVQETMQSSLDRISSWANAIELSFIASKNTIKQATRDNGILVDESLSPSLQINMAVKKDHSDF